MRVLSILMLCWFGFGIFGCGISDSGGLAERIVSPPAVPEKPSEPFDPNNPADPTGPEAPSVVMYVDDIEIVDGRGKLYSYGLDLPDNLLIDDYERNVSYRMYPFGISKNEIVLQYFEHDLHVDDGSLFGDSWSTTTAIRDVEIDVENNHLYVMQMNGLVKTDLNDGRRHPPKVFSREFDNSRMAIDFSRQRLYWLDGIEKKIFSSSLDGSNVQLLHTFSGHGVFNVSDMEFDNTQNALFVVC